VPIVTVRMTIITTTTIKSLITKVYYFSSDVRFLLLTMTPPFEAEPQGSFSAISKWPFKKLNKSR
jgi:hypothetical protein